MQEFTIQISSDEVERAMAFYIQAFGAEEPVEIEHSAVAAGGENVGTPHSELHIGSVVIAFVPPSDLVPQRLAASPVVLDVEDARTAARAAWDAGATIVDENLEGAEVELACHVRDPFGQEWLLRQRHVGD